MQKRSLIKAKSSLPTLFCRDVSAQFPRGKPADQLYLRFSDILRVVRNAAWAMHRIAGPKSVMRITDPDLKLFFDGVKGLIFSFVIVIGIERARGDDAVADDMFGVRRVPANHEPGELVPGHHLVVAVVPAGQDGLFSLSGLHAVIASSPCVQDATARISMPRRPAARLNSDRATARRCTSSGPSANRSARCAAYIHASGVSSDTPAPPKA